MTLETFVILGGGLAALTSVSAAICSAVLERRAPPQDAARERLITITIEDPVGGLIRAVTRSTRRIDQIRRDVERAIRDGC